jgi:alpha-mannosidase
LGDSAEGKREVQVSQGPVAVIVQSRGKFFGGGEMTQTIRFYANHPRIDFEVTTEKIPTQTVVVAEVPLAEEIKQTHRGIPYGFSHGTLGQPDPAMSGYVRGIMPAVRWSDYDFGKGGLAILDRGLTGRELDGNTPLVFLLNASDFYMGYACEWLSGRPRQKFEFALYAHESDWETAQVPQTAWEYNCLPTVAEGVKPFEPKSFVRTSDNVIVEALRREGNFIEMRLVESQGQAGTAAVELLLPHDEAFFTDLTGERAKPLEGGPAYRFSIRPQEIVTLRFKTAKPVKEIEPLLKWDELVPPKKLPQLLKKIPTAKGHPPLGTEG